MRNAFLKRLRPWLYRHKIKLGLLLLLLLWYAFFALPRPLFQSSTATIIQDRKGQLIGGRIADDGQWRFPFNSKVPSKFEKAILTFEDKNFFRHPGFDPVAFARAIKQNVKAKKVVSGGSTISMQVIRLARKGKDRTLFEKLIEMVLATRLELSHSKKEILALYASNAPFGGNVVGLDAASWRYFGRDPSQLSWAEAATLAILPNAPSLIHPGKNRDLLLAKRNRLLDRLRDQGYIDGPSCALAKEEPLPTKPVPIPQFAPHLLEAIHKSHKGQRIRTSIAAEVQEKVNNIVRRRAMEMKAMQVYNAAVLVLDVESGQVLSYVGNTDKQGNEDHGNDVDVITAPRSTGSILKPILYASMLNEGELLPNTLVPDIPTQIAGYTPKNFNLTFDGAVPAKKAVERSLNIPAVRLLQEHGTEKLLYKLQKLGIRDAKYGARHYGLSLILGGAEGSVWDLAGMYASMSRTLKHYTRYSGKYYVSDIRPASYFADSLPPNLKKEKSIDHQVLDAASIWYAYEAMAEVNRPDAELAWRNFSSSTKIAWKTGTSFGFRDGWAIGTTARYVVAVWVGNADGEGRPGLTGVGMAAPLMFDVFDILPKANWFDMPYDDMAKVPVCRKSGYRASDICDEVDTTWVPRAGLKTLSCPYHQMVHLDAGGNYRVTADCEELDAMQHKPWFVLPPVQEYYYRAKDPTYRQLPPFKENCVVAENAKPMELIYPKEAVLLYIPIELDQQRGETIFKVAHRKPNATIFWHLDGNYLGNTNQPHEMGLAPDIGEHVLTLVDEDGYSVSKAFKVAGDKQKTGLR
ncbi:MAG: penicillin-binding protein 1C [Chitinophagales bacterium]|nr:penicillin-binding protein 1C [Chitinophagales bacterium]